MHDLTPSRHPVFLPGERPPVCQPARSRAGRAGPAERVVGGGLRCDLHLGEILLVGRVLLATVFPSAVTTLPRTTGRSKTPGARTAGALDRDESRRRGHLPRGARNPPGCRRDACRGRNCRPPPGQLARLPRLPGRARRRAGEPVQPLREEPCTGRGGIAMLLPTDGDLAYALNVGQF